ncbi:hypothetical protein [Croceicoccus sp. BE223]|uniref:hypothetical protein n=1 Tax=Croceicoccus sp. BE223 TaxID=2817716 RepID=UPI00285E92F1|nr:hypothetical protein [Croceicoccus sp. BE223]MDR7104040.1 uncharacterized membrane protein (DUF485 family) [Croceicoccus sp. BE223]
MIDPPAAPRGAREKIPDFRDPGGPAWPLAAIAILLVAQASMIFTRAVNWDESLHYGQLYDMAAGQPVNALQTLYLRLYLWVAALPGTAIDHVVITRVGQFLCEIAILALIFMLARRFAETRQAAMAVLLYLSTGYVLQNGFALRADPVVTAVLMAILVVLSRPTFGWRSALALGLLGGLAPMLSIKAVLYAPALAGMAWLCWSDQERSRAAAIRLVAAGAITALTAAAIFAWHSSILASADSAVGGSVALADSAARRMFFIGRPNNLGTWIQFAFTGLAFLVLFGISAISLFRESRPAAERLALAGLLVLFLLPFCYENTAAYFYVFMLAPVAAACAIGVQRIEARVPAVVLSAVLVAFAVPVIALDNREVIANQRRLAAELEAMFPKPVAYFDHADVAPHLLKRNPFQSPWGYRGYLAAGVPIYRKAIEREVVPVMVANWFTFRDLFAGNDELFLPADAMALTETYLPFNGPIRLAGKLVPAGSDADFEILVPGPYTVHEAPVLIDGTHHPVGAVVMLERGFHRFASDDPLRPARLLWGRHLAPRDRLDFTATWVPF